MLMETSFWNGAPDEPVTFSIGGREPGAAFLWDLPLQASDAAQTISLRPALHLTAQVVDSKTGQPIAKFRVTPGEVFGSRPEPSWDSANAKSCTQGALDWSSHRMGVGYVFKVEADGYEPLVSELFKTTQSDYAATFKLTKVN